MSARPRNRGNNRSRKGSRNRRRRQGGGTNAGRSSGAGFWGDPAKLPLAQPEVQIAEDPDAVVRSLGPPPLTGHEIIAEHYFAAVYDRAVSLAGALAAAGGLVKLEELPEELTD